LMEKAYSFVSDSSTDQKGRLFLWKLKQIRNDVERHRNLKNYNYNFVLTKMSKTRDTLADLICEKCESEYSSSHKNIFQEIFINIDPQSLKSKREKPRFLILGYCSPRLLLDIEMCGFKIQGVDISKVLSSKMKVSSKTLGLKTKWIVKDFVKNSFEDNCFDVVFLNNYWSFVPEDSEITFLKALKKVLKNNGKLVINSKVSKEAKQEWRTLKHKGQEVDCFVKESTLENMQESFRVLFDDVVFL